MPRGGIIAGLRPRGAEADMVRLQGALTITGQVMATVLVAMAIRMPEAALACYLLFFAARDNAGDSIFTALKLIVAASAGILLAVLLLNLLLDEPMLRLAALATFTFVGMFLSQASRLGPLAATAGFVFAFLLTLVDVVPVPELMAQAMRWMWVVVALPLGLMALWAALAGPRPAGLLGARIRARQAALVTPASPATRDLLDEGLTPSDDWLKFARILGETRGAQAYALAQADDDSYFRLALAEAGLGLARIAALPPTNPAPPVKEPLLRPDAFSDPRHLRFAAKVLIAVLVTYGFYTAFDLFSIHTAMITCFYVALGTRAETHHRIMLRMTGAVLGAVAGIAVMGLLMPRMTDIGHLLLVVGAVTFIAAWIALGGNGVAYAGWQMALCFYLVVLDGFGPPTEISAATARVVGVLVGSGVIWVVFTALWPESARRDALTAIDELDARLEAGHVPVNGRDIAQLREPLARARRLADIAVLEREAGLDAALAAAEGRYHAFLSGNVATGESEYA